MPMQPLCEAFLNFILSSSVRYADDMENICGDILWASKNGILSH